MNHKHTLLTTLLVVAAVSGCKRDTPVAAAPEAASAVAPAAAPVEPASAVTAVVDHGSPASSAPGFDVKAFAGHYAGNGTTLDIGADGDYTLVAQAQSAAASVTTKGSWNAEADGKHVLLDPESKGDADRRFEVVSANELREVEGGLTLKRGG